MLSELEGADHMPLLHRVAERNRPVIRFALDGRSCDALAGDTVLTAVLTNGERLRTSELSGRPRAGFCMMGACQDCWIETEGGDRLRACSTLLVDGMRFVTRPKV